MKELVELLARNLVEHPDQVRVTESGDDHLLVLEIQVAPDDVGKIIGRQGRVVNAIRTVVRAAAGRQGRRVNVEVQS